MLSKSYNYIKIFNNYLKENKLDPSKTILYSFWFDVSALGMPT